MPSPNPAESLPLMREVAKIYLIFDGGRETSKINSLPQSACSADSPLVRGGLWLRITVSAVVGLDSLFIQVSSDSRGRVPLQRLRTCHPEQAKRAEGSSRRRSVAQYRNA